MTSTVWVPLDNNERNLQREALATLANTGLVDRKRIKTFAKKIEAAQPLRDTVLRVQGGFVDVEANPNGVVVYDYDCDGVEDDYLIRDEEGRFCITSEFPPV